MPTLKRHKCRAPVAFHAFMNTRCNRKGAKKNALALGEQSGDIAFA